jgi:hypothetical protein
VDFDIALLPVLPMIALNLRPLRFRVIEYLLWIRAASAFHKWASVLPRFSFGRRVAKLGVQAQHPYKIDSGLAADQIKQIQDGKAAFADEDKIPIRNPSGDQLDDLPDAISQSLMLALLPRVIAPGWAPNHKEWRSVTNSDTT